MIILLWLRRLNWNRAHLCSILILGTLLCESCFVSYMKVLVDIMRFSYWGLTSYLEVRSERYGFSNAYHQTVTWVNTELCDIWKYFQKFLYNDGYCKGIISVVSSTSLIMDRNSLGFENRVKWVWNWNLGSEQSITQNQCSLDQVRVSYELLWTSQHPYCLNHLSPISEASHFSLSISEISETHISFISIKIFSLSSQSFPFGLFCFHLL